MPAILTMHKESNSLIKRTTSSQKNNRLITEHFILFLVPIYILFTKFHGKFKTQKSSLIKLNA